jgi:DNA-directed RNA polymerase subunit RPC12/RpoP
MRNRFREEVYDHPPITIACPYCGQITHMPQPNIDDGDYLMDENCNECDARIFASFVFVPQIVAVYKLISAPNSILVLEKEAAHAS